MTAWFLIEWGVPICAAGGTVAIHQKAIRYVSRRLTVRGHRSLVRSLVRALLVLLGAHFLEIALFAGGFAALEQWVPGAALEGSIAATIEDYIYYSASTYTTLGVGDIVPIGATRLLSGAEALTGLIMIAWTAAFLFAETDRVDS